MHVIGRDSAPHCAMALSIFHPALAGTCRPIPALEADLSTTRQNLCSQAVISQSPCVGSTPQRVRHFAAAEYHLCSNNTCIWPTCKEQNDRHRKS